MEKVAINLPCGRTILVEPKVADMVRKQAQKNRDKDLRLARELKEARMLPSTHFNATAGRMTEAYRRPEPEMNSRVIRDAEKKAEREFLWHQMLATQGRMA